MPACTKCLFWFWLVWSPAWSAWCVKPTYDETRLTKVEWSRRKLPFPSGLGGDEATSLLAGAYPELAEAEQSSLDGPFGRIPEE